jgi:hypothetical protein
LSVSTTAMAIIYFEHVEREGQRERQREGQRVWQKYCLVHDLAITIINFVNLGMLGFYNPTHICLAKNLDYIFPDLIIC